MPDTALWAIVARGSGGERATRAVQSLNPRYAEVLHSPWTTEAGRFSVTLPPPVSALAAARQTEMVFELMLRLHPQPLVLGMGAAATAAQALARAQDACDSAARLRLCVQASGFDETADLPGLGLAVSGAWCPVGALVRTWTERQAQFARWVLRDGVLDWRRETPRFVPERRRKEAAQAFDVSPSVVTESLQAADVAAFRHGLWAAAWQWHAAAQAYRPSALSASNSSMMRS